MKYFISIENAISKIENQTFTFSKSEYSRLKSHIQNNRKICFGDDFTAIRIGKFFYSVWTGKKIR